ncbi:FAS1-like dehydratase domain-containing protein [Faunimonas sp. B44]|uniref:FAS1-like dehydratase domain-containing protein n=1 Tax=Faunimonas sp. B44 TaxID=3461493 RepID=UPI004043D6F1
MTGEEIDLQAWTDRSETAEDTLTPHLLQAYRATVLDEAEPDAARPAPPGIHWCLATAIAPMSAVGPDGHPARGGFLPPVPLPRRMWAGSRIRFHDEFRAGDRVERVSTVTAIAEKEGRTGRLCFVTVTHRFSTARGPAVEEEQDIVYRALAPGAPDPRPVEPAPASDSPADAGRTVDGSAVLLFRYSALTFNSHRIHYDRTYAVNEEGYAGLVVHGPLQASLLMALAASMRPAEPLKRFDFRAERPLFDGGAIVLKGAWQSERAAELWVGPDRAHPHMRATAAW